MTPSSYWFKFNPSAFLVSTAHMTCEEVGIYMRMLCYQWDTGPLPADRVSRMVGHFERAESMGTVMKKFQVQDGLLTNSRLEQTRQERQEFSKKQSAKASLRWQPSGICRGTAAPHATGTAVAHAGDMPQIQIQLQSQLQSNNLEVKSQEGDCQGGTEFTALKIANAILANQFDWCWDNCKVQVHKLKAASLVTIIKPFIGLVPELKIFAAWKEAVRIAHGAKVDGLAVDATAYCVQCFKEQLKQKGNK